MDLQYTSLSDWNNPVKPYSDSCAATWLLLQSCNYNLDNQQLPTGLKVSTPLTAAAWFLMKKCKQCDQEKKKEKWKNGNDALLFISSFDYSMWTNILLSIFTIQFHLM